MDLRKIELNQLNESEIIEDDSVEKYCEKALKF